MKRWTLAALVVACMSCSQQPALPPPTSATPLTAGPEVTLPPEFRAAVGWARLPVAIEPAKAAGYCGEPPGKLVSRVDPPREVSIGTWVVMGCLYSEGNAFTNAFIELSFPDGRVLRAHIADRTPPDREFNYEIRVVRSDVSGMRAQIYVVMP